MSEIVPNNNVESNNININDTSVMIDTINSMDTSIDVPVTVKKVRKSRAKKFNKLSETQVKINHISSEQKRRELVRSLYDDLVEVVPDLQADESRSEMIIYLKTINYLKWLYQRNDYLRSKLLESYRKRRSSSDLRIPDHLIWELNLDKSR